MLFVTLMTSACTAPPSDVEARCGLTVRDLLTGSGAVPAPRATGLPTAAIYQERDGAGRLLANRFIVDPTPELRGDHPSLRATVASEGCVVTTEPLVFTPRATAVAEPDERIVGRASSKHPRIRGMVLTGDAPGTARDAEAWGQMLDVLDLQFAWLHAPTAARTRDAVTRLCDDMPAGSTIMLLMAGRGSPTADGVFELGHEVIRYAELAGILRNSCGAAANILWVIDASWAGGLEADDLIALDAGEDRPTVRLWRASSAWRPDAARTDLESGGALTEVLSTRVSTFASLRCLDAVRPDGSELTALFSDTAVRDELVAQRYRQLGQPALAAAPFGANLELAEQRIRDVLDGDVPQRLLASAGEIARGSRCTVSLDCDGFAPECDRSVCVRLECVEGRCEARPRPGVECNDGDPCTEGDRCANDGICDGTPVDCSDDDPCTLDVCEPAFGCIRFATPEGGMCDDMDACTEGDTCTSLGDCIGQPVVCEDDDQCTVDDCASDVGCIFTAARVACDDGDPCSQGDVCTGGVCSGVDVVCDDGNPCTRDGCELDVGCVFTPSLPETPCDDGDDCTTNERCIDNQCEGIARNCDDELACTLDSCQGGTCTHLAIPGFCVVDGECVATGDSPTTEPCLRCVATGVTAPIAELEGMPCPDDGDPCTTDMCSAGSCRHALAPDTCRRPDGSCADVGEALTSCVLCAATGVGAGAPAGTSCPLNAPCAVGVCNGDGTCVAEAVPCCPALPLECPFTTSGTLDAQASPGQLTQWLCAPDLILTAAEQSLSLTAPCDGTITLTLSAPASARLLVVTGGASQCAGGACDIVADGVTPLAVQAGQELTLTIDGVGGESYTLEGTCECDAPLP